MKQKKLVYGIGINDTDYVVNKLELVGYENGKRRFRVIWKCPYYARWTALLQRVYSPKKLKKFPTYVGCSVVPEWHRFSTFRAWMETQDWEGNHLDKDILIPGNKIYGPEFCTFVSAQVNTFVLDCAKNRSAIALGVSFNQKTKKFVAQISNSLGTKHRLESLGYYSSPSEAHEAWRKRKHELACQLADEQKDERVASALRTRYLPREEG